MIDGMETSKRRDCDTMIPLDPRKRIADGMETSKRRDCDCTQNYNIFATILMEWRPQKEGIATLPNL